MAKLKLTVRWDEVKVGDLIEHPWPKYRSLVGSLIDVTSVKHVGQEVIFGTPAGNGTQPAAGMVQVMREE